MYQNYTQIYSVTLTLQSWKRKLFLPYMYFFTKQHYSVHSVSCAAQLNVPIMIINYEQLRISMTDTSYNAILNKSDVSNMPEKMVTNDFINK